MSPLKKLTPVMIKRVREAPNEHKAEEIYEIWQIFEEEALRPIPDCKKLKKLLDMMEVEEDLKEEVVTTTLRRYKNINKKA